MQFDARSLRLGRSDARVQRRFARKTDGFLAIMPGPVGGDEIRQENPLRKSPPDRSTGAIFSDGSQRLRNWSAADTQSYSWSAGM
jgi:hypothetical protein